MRKAQGATQRQEMAMGEIHAKGRQEQAEDSGNEKDNFHRLLFSCYLGSGGGMAVGLMP